SRVRSWEDVSEEFLEEELGSLREKGEEALEGADVDGKLFERSVDLRYEGQSFEINVGLPSGGDEDGRIDKQGVAERFHEKHETEYGDAYPEEPLELVALRLRARGVVEPPEIEDIGDDGRQEESDR
ncbi:MAG: hydantoinase/oxoprolinase family protein, partial [Halobacteria archaeon]|nr:hydantoinase/oxoprolinase family protein [Halobacteria archaeon]